MKNIYKFISILKCENLITKTSIKSFTEDILARQGIEEQEVHKDFYIKYKYLREKIFNELLKYNPSYEEKKGKLLSLIQKFMDRIIFCWFCEDSREGLLPRNVLSEIIEDLKNGKYYTDQGFTMWAGVKELFYAIDRGGNFNIDKGFNGGLFRDDNDLDNLKIPNFLFIEISHMGKKYDFGGENELNVNVLGHIFEQSISDIEEMQEIFAVETPCRDVSTKISKRKKEGVYYTPEYITGYIVVNTVGEWLKEKYEEVEKKYSRKQKDKEKLVLEEYREEYLKKIKIIDPACGSGAFLIAAFNYLWNEHQWVYNELKKIKEEEGEFYQWDEVEKSILENNIYGVDINSESVEITKLSLWLKTASKDKALNNLDNNIKCGNTLIDDTEVAGEKTFIWEKEFPEIMNNGGFHVVIGNPPYIFAREKIDRKEKDYYLLTYASAQYQVNTYILFIEKAIKLTGCNGYTGLIVPNAWLMVSSGKNLRKFMLDNLQMKEIVNLSGYSFEGINVETIIFIGKKETVYGNEIRIVKSSEQGFAFSHCKEQSDFLKNEGYEFYAFSDEKGKKLSDKIRTDTVSLDSVTIIKAGLKAYETGKGTPKQTGEDVKNRPFDYNYQFNENTHKYLEGRDVNRYYLTWSGGYLKYGEHLAAPRNFDIFNSHNIIIREITGNYPELIIGTYNKEIYLFNMSNIAILERPEAKISLKYILTILNSTLMSYYFLLNTAKSVRKMFPKIILEDLRRFPVKPLDSECQKPFIEKADIMLELNRDFQKRVFKFINRVKSSFNPGKVSQKIETFYNFDFKTFLSELWKQKIKLSLKDQDEWEEYFQDYKKELLSIKQEIDRIDKEINIMVYRLYGIAEEEVKIIENCNM